MANVLYSICVEPDVFDSSLQGDCPAGYHQKHVAYDELQSYVYSFNAEESNDIFFHVFAVVLFAYLFSYCVRAIISVVKTL
jgi:hypothetical protein